MQFDILSEKQKELLSFIAQFKRNYFLVGGTAIALYLGHRRSIDFDLFTNKPIKKTLINQKVQILHYRKHLVYEDADQIHFFINDVKITFFHYPYPVELKCMLKNIISMPSLLSLGAMKAFALNRRAKWKDYVDLYFIFKNKVSIKDISKEALKIFGELFSEKLFRQQLAFHEDIDYSEPIEFINNNIVSQKTVKDFLINIALQDL